MRCKLYLFQLKMQYSFGMVAELINDCFFLCKNVKKSDRAATDGEISLDDVNLNIVPSLLPTDRFLDVGSGYGIVVYQVAMQTQCHASGISW